MHDSLVIVLFEIDDDVFPLPNELERQRILHQARHTPLGTAKDEICSGIPLVPDLTTTPRIRVCGNLSVGKYRVFGVHNQILRDAAPGSENTVSTCPSFCRNCVVETTTRFGHGGVLFREIGARSEG